MSERASNKTGASFAEASRVAPGLRVEQVRELQAKLFATLRSGIENTLLETENGLFEAMNKARDNESRSNCLENIAALRSCSKPVAEGFLTTHQARFKAYFSGQADVPGKEEAAPAAGGLSLLGKADHEENLLITTMASRLSREYGLELIVMRRRLACLVDAEYNDETLTPLCPESVAGSLQLVLYELKVLAGLRSVLYLHFERQVMHALQQLYGGLGAFFQERNILPELTVDDILAEMSAAQRARQLSESGAGKEEGRADAETAEAGAHPADRAGQVTGQRTGFAGRGAGAGPVPGGGQGAAGEQAGNTPFQQQIEQQIVEINQLLGNYRNTLGVVLPSGSRMLDSFAPPGASQSYREDQIMQALQSMQYRGATGAITEGQSTDAFKQGMYQALAATISNPEAYRIDGSQSNLVDLVGMLFDFVKEEKRLPGHHKDMLTHLQNLYCQVALRDASFFHNTEHPAHLLLNRMVHVGSQYQGENEQKQLSEVIEETVRQALVEYQHDDRVFERLLEQFDQHVEVLRQRVERREQRTVDAAKGREKLVFARKHARGFIEVCLKRYGPPEIVREFLQAAWADVLVLYFLRTGPSSPQWQEKAKIAEKLAWSCTPLRQAQHEAFLAHKDMLMSGIQQALEQLGCYSASDIQRVIEDLQLCQQAVQAEQHEVVERLNNTLASSMSETDEEELKTVGEVDESTLDTASQELVDRLKHVRFGTWFEFDKPPHRLKLAWFSPTTQRYMFVDSAGQGGVVKHWNELYELMRTGEAKMVETAELTPFFERALQAIQRTLKQFAGNYVSEIRASKPAGA